MGAVHQFLDLPIKHLKALLITGLFGLPALGFSQTPCENEWSALKIHLSEEDRQFQSVIGFYDAMSFELDDLLAEYFALEGQDHTPLALGTFDSLSDFNAKVLDIYRLAQETAETLAEQKLIKIAAFEACFEGASGVKSAAEKVL